FVFSASPPYLPSFPTRRSSDLHLHVHTEFSMVDSTIRVPAKPDQADPKKAKQPNILSRSVEMGAPALAITDLNNLFALVKFYKRSEEHTSELQSRENLVCRLLL